MVASFATAAARRGQRWTYVVRIEGIGDEGGQYSWSATIPDFASTNAQWHDTLAELPDPTAERAPFLGGMPEAGTVQVKIVDTDDHVTAALRTERGPSTFLDGAITSTGTTIVVADGSALPSADFVIWLGSEAIRIDTRSGDTLTVDTRGYLDTSASAHDDRASVYESTPFLRTRRMSVYLAATDASSDAVATEYLLGTYRIDRIALDPRQLGVWVLSGASEMKELSRLVCGSPPGACRVTTFESDGSLHWEPINASRGVSSFQWQIALASGFWPDTRVYYRVGGADGEVIECATDAAIRSPIVRRRARLNTKQGAINPGDTLFPVATADLDYGWIRWSPGPTPSTSRGSGTWYTSNHAVDWMLCVLTSSAHEDDELELLNDSSAGNWSVLPVGYGVGFPADRIDFDSFLAVKSRFPNALFPGVTIADTDGTFAEWATKHFLKPMGWFLAIVDGLLTLVAPRLLLADETSEATIDTDAIVSVNAVSLATELVAGVITYRFKGLRGAPATQTIRATDFIGLFGSRSQYTIEDDAIEIEVPGVSADQAGLNSFLLSIAQRRLLRALRAPWKIAVTVDASFHALYRGAVVELTHPDLPNLEDGTRGWAAVKCQVTHMTPVHIEPNVGAVMELELIAFPSLAIGRIAPSAWITSRTGTGPWACTVRANRYTAPTADDYEALPDVDAEAFTATDKVKTILSTGAESVTGLTVDSVSGNVITVSGASAPSVGEIIVFADYADATTAQRGAYAAWADGKNEIATGVPGWPYGEA